MLNPIEKFKRSILHLFQLFPLFMDNTDKHHILITIDKPRFGNLISFNAL